MKTHIFVEQSYGKEAIEFYKFVFGAREVASASEQLKTSDETKDNLTLVSCELKFGPSSIIVSELNPDSSLFKKGSGVGTQSVVWLEMEEIDSVVEDAQELDSVLEGEITTTPRGRLAKIRDPYGHLWMICSPAPAPAPAPVTAEIPSSEVEG